MKYLALILLISFQTVSAERYVINVTESLISSPYRASLEGYLTMAYSRLGIKPEFKYYPSNRGIKLVTSNHLDAEAVRLGLVGEHFPNLIKVEEPLVELKLGLFCLKKEDCVIEPSGIYARIQGFKGAEILCDNNEMTCIESNSSINIAKMLDKRRVNALFASFYNSPQVLCESENKVFYYSEVALGQKNSYHYVSRDNALLAPKLAIALKQIKQSYGLSKLQREWHELAEDCGLSLIPV